MHLHATALQNLRTRVQAAKEFDLIGIHTDLEEEMLAAGIIGEKPVADGPRGLTYFFYIDGALDPNCLAAQYDLCTRAVNEQVTKGLGPILKALGMVRPLKKPQVKKAAKKAGKAVRS